MVAITPEGSKRRLVRKIELLEIIPISARTLDGYLAKRIIPFVKVSRIVLFDPEEVLKALKKFERKAS
jgi:hypothetical protein